MKLKKLVAMLIVVFMFVNSTAVFAMATDTETAHTHDIQAQETQAGEDIDISGSTDPVTPANVLCDVFGHTKGTHLSNYWKSLSSKVDTYCYYKVKYDTYKCGRCNTIFNVKTDEIQSCTHNRTYVYNETGTLKGFTCTLCGYCSWK